MPVAGGATCDTDSIQHCALHALKAADLGIWRWDVDGGSVLLCEQASCLLGCDPAVKLDFAGFLDLIHPSQRQAVHDTLRWAAAAKSDFDFDLTISATPARSLR